MKLHVSVGPNPRVVKMFLAEKGLEIDLVKVDLMGGENRREPYNTSVNRAGQTPALELDDGSTVSEITAICEYLEERQPSPPLIGATAEERAATRMWTRRVDLKVCEPMANGFRYAEGLALFQSRMRVLPDAAEGLKAVAKDGRHPAVRLHLFRRPGRPTPGPGIWQADRMVRTREGAAERGGQRLAHQPPVARPIGFA
jgi:glutathione S-transferase